MAGRIYSERFLHGRAVTATQSLLVPTGKRAVIRFLTVCTFDQSGLNFNFRVAGTPVVFLHDPAVWTERRFDLRLVAYAGEAIEVITDGADISWHVSGFLFADS